MADGTPFLGAQSYTVSDLNTVIFMLVKIHNLLAKSVGEMPIDMSTIGFGG